MDKIRIKEVLVYILNVLWSAWIGFCVSAVTAIILGVSIFGGKVNVQINWDSFTQLIKKIF